MKRLCGMVAFRFDLIRVFQLIGDVIIKRPLVYRERSVINYKMAKYCDFFQCFNCTTNKELSFHKFPKDINL
jgi:hypothetical protein